MTENVEFPGPLADDVAAEALRRGNEVFRTLADKMPMAPLDVTGHRHLMLDPGVVHGVPLYPGEKSNPVYGPDVPGYELLRSVLERAYDQSARGKGNERHANAKPFHEQPMQVIADATGLAFITGQVMKKVQESMGLPHEKAVHELLGAIVYAAGAVIWLERHNGKP